MNAKRIPVCSPDALRAICEPFLHPEQRIWVGFSGGLDSTVLMDLLTQAYPKRVRAIHVHHGLHPEADVWVQKVEEECQSRDLPLTLCYADPKQFQEKSPEAAARAARFLAWSEHIFGSNEILMLAHHIDDQAETLLHRLCRGTGVLGLTGMSLFEGHKHGYPVARPFLGMGLDRVALTQYAQARGLSWIEDSSNQDLRFDRNFLRSEILPRLKARWPKTSEAIHRSAQLCQTMIEPVLEQAAQDLADLSYVSEAERGCSEPKLIEREKTLLPEVLPGSSLSVQKVLTLPAPRRREALRRWFHEQSAYAPSFEQLERIETEILRAYPGGRPRLKIGRLEVRRWRDWVFLSRYS